MVRKIKNLIITDDFGNIDDCVLPEEIKLLMPYADELLGPILKQEKAKEKKSGWKK